MTMGKFFLYCEFTEIIVIAHIYLHISMFPEFSAFPKIVKVCLSFCEIFTKIKSCKVFQLSQVSGHPARGEEIMNN